MGIRFVLLFFAMLVLGCSSNVSVSLRPLDISVERSGGSAGFLLQVDGAARDPVSVDEIQLAAVPATAAILEEQGVNVFLIQFNEITAPADTIKSFLVQAEVRGAKASATVPFASGDVHTVAVDVPDQVNADAATAPVRIRVFDSIGNPAVPASIKLDTSLGVLDSLETEGDGSYLAVLAGLTKATANAAVTVTVRGASQVGQEGGTVRATRQFSVLVGALGGFAVEVATDVLQANEAIPLQVRATDRHGNFRSAYDGTVSWQVKDADGSTIPIFPVKSNTFAGGELLQLVSLGARAIGASLYLQDVQTGISSTAYLGDVERSPVRCLELRREGLKSRIFTADDGADPNGAVFNAYLYSLECADLEARLAAGDNVLAYTVDDVFPLVVLQDANGNDVGRSDVAGHGSDDLIGDVRATGLGYLEIPIYNLTNVAGSPYQLIASVGNIATQVQVEITPGAWVEIGIDPIPDVAVPLPAPANTIFSIYVRARDAWGNVVLTETAAVQCDYANTPLATPLLLNNMVLGSVSGIIDPPSVAGPERLQCWYGGVDYASASLRGFVDFNVHESGKVNPVDVLLGQQYIERFAVVLPGQSISTANGSPEVIGSPDPQIAGEPFTIEVVPLSTDNDTYTFNPDFDGQVYLSSPFGALRTVNSLGQTLQESPMTLAMTPNGFPFTSFSSVEQEIVISDAGTHLVQVNQGDGTLPLPGPRSNIALLDLSLPQNSSSLFDVRSGEFDHFAIDPIPSPQLVGTPFVLTVRAVDAQGNVLAGYNALADIEDNSDSLNIKTASFVDGILQETLVATRDWHGNRVHVTTGDGESISSNVFDVVASDFVDSFLLYGSAGAVTECLDVVPGQPAPPLSAPSNVSSGESFALMLVALDGNNNVAEFNWPVALTDFTGTLNQTQSASLYRGCLVLQDLKLRKAGSTFVRAEFAAAGNAAAGQTPVFQVSPGAPARVDLEIVSALPVVRDGGQLDIEYTVVDAAGNVVTDFDEMFTVVDDANTMALSPGTTTASSGLGSFSATFTGVAIDNRLRLSHSSVTAGFVEGFTDEFDVIVIPDSFDVLRPDGSPIEPVTAYEPFDIMVIARDAGGQVLTDFSQSVSIASSHGVVVPESLPDMTAGGVTTEVILHIDDDGATPAFTVSFASPMGVVESTADTFAIDSTAYVSVGDIPDKIEDNESFALHLEVRRDVDNQPIPDFSEGVELVFYGLNFPAFQCDKTIPLDAAVDIIPNPAVNWTDGTVDISARMRINNQVLNYNGCIGARLPDSNEVYMSNQTQFCGLNAPGC